MYIVLIVMTHVHCNYMYTCMSTCVYLSLSLSLSLSPSLSLIGTCPVDSNGDQSTPTGNQYLLIAPPSKTRPSHKEFCPLKDHPTNAPHSPPGVTPPTTPPTPDPVFEALKSQFNEKQIQALVDMLAKMNDRGGGGGEANIGYLVTKTANTLTDSM